MRATKAEFVLMALRQNTLSLWKTTNTRGKAMWLPFAS